MMHNYSRRAVIAALLGSAATGAFSDAPLTSLRPTGRPPKAGTITSEMRIPLADVIRTSGVTGRVGVVLADATTGEIIDSNDANEQLPPASVTKVVTALYALESLGPDFQFETRIFADSPVLDGVLDGNLILSGGGNPNLVTDDLAELAERLKDSGLTEVRGKFYVYDGALPNLDEIDESQLDHLGYNPAITGLNLNFNRVYFEWKRTGGAYTVTMDARSAHFRPAVTVAKMRIVDRSVPVYTYHDGGGLDEWTVARGALGSGGSRWLPVRYPALYAGEVFASFARGHGIVLTPPSEIALARQGEPIATHKSVPLSRMMQDMLRFSTNITAEAAGMAATESRTGQKRGLRTSALGMTLWAKDRAGITPSFADHSGLGDTTRLSAADMVTLLNADGVDAVLNPILKTIPLRDDKKRVIKDHPAQVVAKTGTLNFVSALAGYIRTGSGRKLTFAIFAADLDAREIGKASNAEQPTGSITFNTNAKKLQNKLLRRWAALND
ncbi:MAG: D-alanyl-D-alanine carboxypeptidase/D-alanyl-D-alanine-endopeptidase [Yoonia sp.]|nr:D-alanyl-D-alanine carboxypeptidase/D-alanyl-D-alanine-endopeptidase [Yoonia sp.]